MVPSEQIVPSLQYGQHTAIQSLLPSVKEQTRLGALFFFFSFNYFFSYSISV